MTLAPLLGLPSVYAAAHLVCHQVPARSFHLASGPMAVCARCVGLYLGAVVGGAYAIARSGAPPLVTGAAARRLFGIAAVPMLLTLVGEWLFKWPVGNGSRFAAALPLGAVAAWLVVHALEVDWRA